MKQAFLLLLAITTLSAYSQKTSLTTVNTVKPRAGQKMAFEAAYKAHVAKFHKGDEKLNVYEVLSGTYIGYYHLVNAASTFEGLDKERPDAAAHNLDLDKNFFPLLEVTMNGTFRFMDSLSIHKDIVSDKAIVNVRHINPSMEADYRKESAKGVKAINNLSDKFWQNLNVSVFEQIWDGSDPVVVSIRGLKDGFQSLETDFYGSTGSSFKDEYVKQYGTADWDKRVKLFDDAVVKTETYIMRYRKDLSSQ